MPQIKGLATFKQSIGVKSFWFMCSFMALLTPSFVIARIVQTYFQKIIGMDFLTTQEHMRPWYAAC